MNRIFRWCTLITLLLLQTVWGQENLTLGQAWEIAVANNLNLQQQAQDLRSAETEVNIRKADYLPAIAAGASYNYVSELARLEFPASIPGFPGQIEAGANNQYDLALNLRQTLFSGFLIRNRVRAAESLANAEQVRAEITRQQLLLQVGRLYYEIQSNLTRQAVLQEGIARIDDHLRMVRNFFHAGQAASFDTLEAANRKLEQQNQLKNLENLQRILLTQFRFALNASGPVTVQPLNLAAAPQQPGVLDNFLNEALSRRPEMRYLELLGRAGEYRTGTARSRYFPQLAANAAWHYARPGVNFFRNEWMDYYTISLSMRWDIWNWGQDRRQVQQAHMAERKLDLQRQQLTLDIRQQVTEAYELLDNARQQILLQQRLVLQERERYRITENQFNEGLVSNLDLSSAERTLSAAELLLQDYYIQWHRQRLQLSFATGTIGEDNG